MAVQNWEDAPEIRPSDIRVGDIIGALPDYLRYKVKVISGPRKSPGQWTFFGSDDWGRQHTTTFREDDFVRRYAKAS